MPKYPPLKYRDVEKILRNLGFVKAKRRSTAHQTWKFFRNNRRYSVTVATHQRGKDVPKGTLSSMIRQSGFMKEEFYAALRK